MPWLERHLGALVGVTEAGDGGTGEGFAAWRRFFEALSEDRPLVLVLEDLHWADEAMLDFVDQLAERVRGVPLLVLGTARPELLGRRSGWGGGMSNALTISLSPLSDGDTTRLLQALLGQPVLEAATQEALLVRAGGNPLYAEQYARALDERGDVLELPDTVQGIIAARLDALSAEEKTLLQDAAVVGKVFWLGALLAIGDRPRSEAEDLLHALERKEFVQRSRTSSVGSESEYAFRHLLIRDVAYGQIPRAARAEKHRLTAEWIESLGRSDDQAEMLAHHYLQALELAVAAGMDTAVLSDRARLALRAAGDRAAALYAVDAASRFYDAALALWPETAEGRAQLLLRRAAPARLTTGGDPDRLTEARDALLTVGDREGAAEAEVLLARAVWQRGDRPATDRHVRDALALVADAPPSRTKVFVLTAQATQSYLTGNSAMALEYATQAAALAAELGWAEGLSEALLWRGTARVTGRDTAGLADTEEAITVAAEAGILSAQSRGYNSLGVLHATLGDSAPPARPAARRDGWPRRSGPAPRSDGTEGCSSSTTTGPVNGRRPSGSPTSSWPRWLPALRTT